MEKKRIYLYDNLKFFLILFVLIGHFMDFTGITDDTDGFRAAFIFLYSFHMPLFIFISGLFYSSKDVFRKIASFLAAGIIAEIVIFLSKYILFGVNDFSLTSISGVPWYMLALAAFMALNYVFRDVNKVFMLVVAVLIACFAGYSNEIGDEFTLSRIIVFYPFYILGSMTNKVKLEELSKNVKLKIAGGAVLVIWAVICALRVSHFYYLRLLFTGRNSFADTLADTMMPYGSLYRLMCYAMAVLFGLSLICLCSARKLPVITTIGQRTLQVYFWHSTVIYILMSIPATASLTTGTTGTKLLFVLFSIPTLLILSRKPFAFPCNIIMKGSKPTVKKNQQ